MNRYSESNYLETSISDCRGIYHKCECFVDSRMLEGYDYNVFKIDGVIVKEDRITNKTHRYPISMRMELEEIMEQRDNAIKWNAEVMYNGALVPYGGWHKVVRT